MARGLRVSEKRERGGRACAAGLRPTARAVARPREGERGSAGLRGKKPGLWARKQLGSFSFFFCFVLFRILFKAVSNQFENILTLLKLVQYKSINAPA